MLIEASANNNPMGQKRLANITCFKCGLKGHYEKDCPSSASTSPGPIQYM